MFKVTPNPPVDDLASPASQSAIERAFAHYDLPPPPTAPFVQPKQSHGLEELLAQVHEILDCASATAYECTDSPQDIQRKLNLAVVHLLDLAQIRVNQALEHPQLGT